MTEGNITKCLLTFAAPLILGNLLQQLYSTADSIIVGNFVGSGALAAVGASTSLINLLISFSQGASVGAGVVVSQFLGAKDRQGVHNAVHTALAIGAILGIILTVGGVLACRTLLIWMGTPEDILPEAVAYLRIYAMGIWCGVLYNMTAGILNAVGNSRRSLLYLAAASLTNIVMDLVLIGVFGMGVEGAAIATVLSELLSGVLALAFLTRTQEAYRVQLRQIRLQGPMARQIVRVGLPAGIQNMVISLANVFVQSSVNVYGADAVAGFGAYLKVDGFNILPVTSLSMAATTFVGQNYGAGRYDRIRQAMVRVLVMTVAYTILAGVVLLTFSHAIMGLFTSDAAVIEAGQEAMLYFCPFYWLLGILHSLAGAVRGTGKTVPPMAVLLLSLCLFRIVWLQFIYPLMPSLGSIFVVYPTSWVVGVVLMVLYTWKGHWLTPKEG